MPTPSTLQIQPLSIRHLPRYTTLTRSAFAASSPNTLCMLGPVTPSLLTWYSAHDLAAFERNTKDDHWLGVFNSSLPKQEEARDREQLIAVARWTLKSPALKLRAKDEKTVEIDNKAIDKGAFPPQANVPALQEFYDDLAGVETQVMGQRGRYWVLTGLATEARHAGRGAGKMLVRWGIDRAEREGRECFLIGNRGSKGLYEKLGFVVARKCGWDGEKWGAGEGWGNWAMVRKAGGG